MCRVCIFLEFRSPILFLFKNRSQKLMSCVYSPQRKCLECVVKKSSSPEFDNKNVRFIYGFLLGIQRLSPRRAFEIFPSLTLRTDSDNSIFRASFQLIEISARLKCVSLAHYSYCNSVSRYSHRFKERSALPTTSM